MASSSNVPVPLFTTDDNTDSKKKVAAAGDSSNSNVTSVVKKDTLLDHMDISVTEAEKRANSALNIREHYTVYLIETKVTRPWDRAALQPLCLLWRRYSEFEQLRAYLEVTYLWAVVAPLPEKRPLYPHPCAPTDTLDPDFVDRRRAGLENFLHRIADHPILSTDPIFIGFLQEEEGWRENVKSTGYLQQAESKLRTLSVGARLRSSDPKFEEIKSYAAGLHSGVHGVLRARSRLAARSHTIHRLHHGYGRVFSEWSVIEKEMGDGLQKAGHFFDSISAGIGAALEEEELIIDQLKEYLFFARALEALCRRQEVLQLELEQAEDNLKARQMERLRAEQGRSGGLMSRLFGSVEPEEAREVRLNSLDSQILEGEQLVNECRLVLSDFSEKATNEFDSFLEKKASDLRDTLASYVTLQMKMARKGLQTWTHIKDCIEGIP